MGKHIMVNKLMLQVNTNSMVKTIPISSTPGQESSLGSHCAFLRKSGSQEWQTGRRKAGARIGRTQAS
jgi:hypothetical protein